VKTDPAIYSRPAELLQNLIRFDTTNPPGNERPCTEYINTLFTENGIDTSLVAKTPGRPNLIARLKGEGKAPPLLLYGHMDVVTTHGQKWTYPPFEGRLVDGYIWGRGALDMKHGIAMYLAALLQAKAEKIPLPGDVIFCAVTDEEDLGTFGSGFLVSEHASLFQGVKYALSEFGGFNMNFGGKRIYPIMVAEKQCCWMKITFHGRGGHGSMPVHRQAMAKLSRSLRLLDRKHLPYHLTPPARLMMMGMATAMGGVAGLAMRALTSRLLVETVLSLLGERGNLFAPLLHNTVSPTIVKASEKVNVIPSEISLALDGRLLPGYSPEDMEKEVRSLLGEDFELEILEFSPGPAAPNMELFDTLGEVIKGLDPAGCIVPYMMSGVTDARLFSRLGIQTYGFTPLQLPDDFSFIDTIHAANERVPVKALEFGAQAVLQVLKSFH